MLPMTLKFEKAGEVKVDLKVEENAPAGMPASGAHQH
jgi:copper(I)-binding protein